MSCSPPAPPRRALTIGAAPGRARRGGAGAGSTSRRWRPARVARVDLPGRREPAARGRARVCSRPARTCSRTTRGPVAFAVDCRFARRRDRRDGHPRRRRAPGVVLRRVGAARLLRGDLRRRAGGAPARAPQRRPGSTSWRAPSRCRRPAAAAADACGVGDAPDRAARRARPTRRGRGRRDRRATARAALQRPGDPGVLATARTLFPSAGPRGAARARQPPPAALRRAGGPGGHGDRGRPGGRRRRSASARRRPSRDRGRAPRERPRPSAPSVVAATTGAPVARRRACCTSPPTSRRACGSRSRTDPRFRRAAPRRRRARPDRFDAAHRARRAGCEPGRPRLLARAAAPHAAVETVGPGAQLPRPAPRPGAASARGSRSARARRSSARSSSASPDARPDVVRLAGRPQLPRHASARWRRRPAATPASGATSSPTRGSSAAPRARRRSRSSATTTTTACRTRTRRTSLPVGRSRRGRR